MGQIEKERPSRERLAELGVERWSPWECEPSTFDWEYGDEETCYVLEGQVRVKTLAGEEVEFGAGDLVRFPKGLKCTWEVVRKIRKVYRFG
jgi:uncharacterized cupin superfamily protein